MQVVSQNFLNELQQPIVGKAECRILFDLVDADAASICSFDAQDAHALSVCDSLLTVQRVQEVSASFEQGRLQLGARQVCVPDTLEGAYEEGYISSSVCDVQGVFDTAPTLEICFSQPCTLPALTFVFDTICNDYPTEIKVQTFLNDTACDTFTCNPTDTQYVLDEALGEVDAIVITFLQMSCGARRARMQQILFGKQLIFPSNLLTSVSTTTNVDPLSRRLPSSSLQFSVVNYNPLLHETNPLYDPENPDGLGQYIEQHSAAQVLFGQTLSTTGEVEWVEGGRYYLTAEPTTQGLLALFEAQDVFSLLTNTFYKGVYSATGTDLYTLAQQVLADADLPQLVFNADPWDLWDGLQAITTDAPLPLLTHRECLQLIAHAAGCALYCTRDGVIHLAPCATQDADFELAFSDILDEPTLSKSATLYAVTCDAYHLSVDDAASKLHSATYEVDGTLDLHITHAGATQISYTVSGGSAHNFSPYAYATDLTLVGTGAVTLTLTGYALTTSTSTSTAAVENPDNNAAQETVQNEIITSTALALAAATRTRDYLLERISYSVETLGRIELDPLDCLVLETLYESACPVRLIETCTTYSGDLRTTLLLKQRGDF